MTPPIIERVLVAGDTHGNGMWLEILFNHAIAHRCNTVVQLGDFGYWPHDSAGVRFLRRAEFLADRADIPLVWLPGNHENWSRLQQLEPLADGFVEISPHVMYAPPGHRWVWSDTRFAALGGAFSIDWRTRKVGASWWPDEALSVLDLQRLGSEPTDVLLTHDAPYASGLVGTKLRADDQRKSSANQRLVDEAIRNTTPQLVLHGHWHHRYSKTIHVPYESPNELEPPSTWHTTRVEGLASDIEHDGTAWGVLELPALRFTAGSELDAG